MNLMSDVTGVNPLPRSGGVAISLPPEKYRCKNEVQRKNQEET